MIIRLTKEEMEAGVAYGKAMQIRAAGKTSALISNLTGPVADDASGKAIIAVSLALKKQPVPAANKPEKYPQFEPNIYVRTTMHTDGHLIYVDSYPLDAIYVFAPCYYPDIFDVVGWATGKQIVEKGFFKPGSGHWLKQHKLNHNLMEIL